MIADTTDLSTLRLEVTLDITSTGRCVAMLEIGIPLLVGFAVGIGVGYYVREQVLRKERIERRLFL